MKKNLLFVFILTIFVGISALAQDEDPCYIPNPDKTWLSFEFPDGAIDDEYLVKCKFKTNMEATNVTIGTSSIPIAAYGDYNAITRFGTDYSPYAVDARNGGVYAKDVDYMYMPDIEYFIRMEIDIKSKTYNVFLNTEGEDPVQVADAYAFREDNATDPAEHLYFGLRSNSTPPAGTAVEEMIFEICELWIGYVDDEVEETSNNEMSVSNLEVYPNPAKEYIQLSIGGSISIYGIAGNLVKQISNVNKGEKISVSDLSKGVYLLKINEGNSIHAKKIIIE